MKSSLLVPPAIEPISLAEAKSWLRIDGDDENELLRFLIVSARMRIEAHTRRFFVTQTWRLVFDEQPVAQSCAAASLPIPFAPFQGVAALRVYDSAGVAQTVAPTNYRAASAGDGARIDFLTPPPQPMRPCDGVEADVVVGYGDRADDTPEPLRQAILSLIAQGFENRGDAGAVGELSPAVVALAAPFRRERLR